MLSTLFARKPRSEAPLEDDAAKAAEIPYDPALTASLTRQHRALVRLLVDAQSASLERRYEDVQHALAGFKTALEQHQHHENIHLHPYLTAHLKGEGGKEILKEMHTNAAHIKRTVEGFLNHYTGYPVNERNAARFDAEISAISEEFCERIEREEATVYTLYMPPGLY